MVLVRNDLFFWAVRAAGLSGIVLTVWAASKERRGVWIWVGFLLMIFGAGALP